MSKAIPQVRTWNIRILATDTKPEERVQILAPTRFLAKLNLRYEYPGFWGRMVKISLAKS